MRTRLALALLSVAAAITMWLYLAGTIAASSPAQTALLQVNAEAPTDVAPTASFTPTATEPPLPFETPFITLSVSSKVIHTGERFNIASYTNAGMADVGYRIEPSGLVTHTWQPCGWYPDLQCQTNPWLAIAPGIISIWASAYGEVCCWYWGMATMTEPITLTITGPEITLTPTSTPSPTPTSTSTPTPTATASPTIAPTHYLILNTSSDNVALGHIFTVEAHTDLGIASFGYRIEPSSLITFNLPAQYDCARGVGRPGCDVVQLRPISPGVALINANAYGETCCWFFTGTGTRDPITITITGTLMWYPIVLR